MDPPSRHFTLALAASLLLHALLLSIHFRLPEALMRAKDRALDVILVNSKSQSRPTDAQARAQANLDGGGNTDENRRIKTPLPALHETRDGDDLIQAQRRVAELEAHRQQLLTQTRSSRSVRPEERKKDPQPTLQQAPGLDLASNALAIARLQGQIDRQTEAYNQRPKRHFYSPRTSAYRFAQYVEDWRQKIERIGNLNYPEAAKGRLYGSLIITVEIKADGSVATVEIDRSSGKHVLDDAARRIVQLAGPYAPFPPDIRRDTDILSITRTWSFTSSDRLQSE
ncbi:MAG: energy transducer TonB [Rhodocyclaceae bacterium]|nr:MAG: energy transducer TonB [Rhodocyclaceae bacterium]